MRRVVRIRRRGTKAGRLVDPKLITSALRTAAKKVARANVMMAEWAREVPSVKGILQEARNAQDQLHNLADQFLEDTEDYEPRQ